MLVAKTYSGPMTFDIETIPDPELIDLFLEPPDVRYGNTKDPEKRAEIERAAVQKRVDEAALNPHVSRVMSVHARAGNSASLILSGLTDYDERELLDQAWKLLAVTDQWITFNGAQFDVPFLMRRSLCLGIRPPVDIPTRVYDVVKGHSHCPHVDVRQVLASTTPGNGPPQFRRGDLDYYARLLLGWGKIHPEIDHAVMWRLWLEGGADGRRQIAECGEDDVRLTRELFGKIDGFYCC